MPMSPRLVEAINPIIAHPDVALPIIGGLLAVGTGLKLSHLFEAAQVDYDSLSDEELMEADLLSKAAPNGFWHRCTKAVHQTVTRGPATLRWHRGIWNVQRPLTHVGPGEAEYDWQATQVITPMLEGDGLVPDAATMAMKLSVDAEHPPIL